MPEDKKLTPLEEKWEEKRKAKEVEEANVVEEVNIQDGSLRSYHFKTKLVMQLPEDSLPYVENIMKTIQDELNKGEVIKIEDEDKNPKKFIISFSTEKKKDTELMRNIDIRSFIVDLLLQNNIQEVCNKEPRDLTFVEEDLKLMEPYFNGQFVYVEGKGLVKKEIEKFLSRDEFFEECKSAGEMINNTEGKDE